MSAGSRDEPWGTSRSGGEWGLVTSPGFKPGGRQRELTPVGSIPTRLRHFGMDSARRSDMSRAATSTGRRRGEWLGVCRVHFKPFFFYLAAGAALGVGALARDPSAWPTLLGLGLGGLLLWPFLEYAVHRGLHARARSARVRAFLYRAHGIHHAAPQAVGSIFIRFSASASLSALLFLLFVSALGSWPKAAALLIGLWAGYLLYEFTHYVAHFGRPRTAWMRRRQRHHQLHHHREDARFGVTTSLVDWLFGTQGASEKV